MEKWNSIAEKWIKEWNGLDNWQIEQREKFVEYLEPLILDLGCGSGKDVYLFNDIGFTCVGIDFSKKMLKNSSNTICASIDKIPFKDNSFDGVWSCSAVKYLSIFQFIYCLGEVRRVLKPNGIFWLGTEEGKGKTKEGKCGTKMMIKKFQVKEIQTILNQAGFKVLKTEKFKKWRDFITIISRNDK